MDPLQLFRALAESGQGRGRPAGGDAEYAARRLCTTELEALGFTVVGRSFEFSTWPGRWATPLAGLLLVLGGALTWFGTVRGAVTLPLTIGSIFLTVAAVGGAFIGEFGPTGFRIHRQSAINLEAVRGIPRGAPALWLTAHLDTKSQTIPMLLRIASIVCCGAAWAIILSLWMLAFFVHIPGPIFAPFALLATLSAIPLMFTFVGNASTGALDNASGVAAVLATVSQLDPTLPIGVLLTSAEELGLAGARAWVHNRPLGIAINIDSIDDCGQLLCMLSRDTSDHLHAAIHHAARACNMIVAVRSLIPGILVDTVAFHAAGWPAVTISRGRLRSLLRIHTSRDNMTYMSGTMIEATARFVTCLIGAIIAGSSNRQWSTT